MTPLDEPVIQIRKLYKRFGKTQALNGLDLEVFRGDIYGFTGPNGSGKSTTIRILLSLIKPDAGQVRILGQHMPRAKYQVLGKIGALIERPGFYEHLSAVKNLSLLLQYGGRKHDAGLIEETLENVGLKGRENDRVHHYSEGMKQRLGIAQAILHKPEILILDEPFSNLDPEGVKDIRELIVQLNREKNITAIVSSHNLDEIEKLVNRIVLIKKGKSLAEGSIQEVIDRGALMIRLETDEPEQALRVLKDSPFPVEHLAVSNGRVVFGGLRNQVPEINAYLVQQGIHVFSISPDTSLESYFLTLVKQP